MHQNWRAARRFLGFVKSNWLTTLYQAVAPRGFSSAGISTSDNRF